MLRTNYLRNAEDNIRVLSAPFRDQPKTGRYFLILVFHSHKPFEFVMLACVLIPVC